MFLSITSLSARTFKRIAPAVTCIALAALVSCGTVTSNSEYSSADKKENSQQQENPGYDLVHNENFKEIALADNKKNKDMAAILAMQGEYKVGFHFEETVVLQDDYERHAPKDSGGFETVLVLEESPENIVFQHILVSPGGHVVKHWRQDWIYEAKNRLEFVEDQTWEVITLSPENTEGAWTQCVYEVSDAPRYCGTGKWRHEYGVSTWTSDRTWRPLPRREYTVREDYNALNVENRHTVTPQGWTHEQDNTKTVRNGKDTYKTIVREFGFNDYRRIDSFDFSPAYDYWTKTSEYWARVRNIWSQRIGEKGKINLKTEVDGMPIIEATFKQASEIEKGGAEPAQNEIEAIFNEWVAAVIH